MKETKKYYSHIVKSNDNCAFCTCQKSESFPFCDGNHRGSSFKPIKITFQHPSTILLCRCGKTTTPPYCNSQNNCD
ncbi:MAG: CDGSH-type Zn-finger protein [bacterium]|jgi:CDGSH-type Zn-finger protein